MTFYRIKKQMKPIILVMYHNHLIFSFPTWIQSPGDVYSWGGATKIVKDRERDRKKIVTILFKLEWEERGKIFKWINSQWCSLIWKCIWKGYVCKISSFKISFEVLTSESRYRWLAKNCKCKIDRFMIRVHTRICNYIM